MKLFKTKLSHYSWRGRLAWVLSVVLVVALCFVSEITGVTDRLFLWTNVSDKRELPGAGEIQVHVLDVGNADAIVLFCDSRTMLIDAGDYNDGTCVTDFLERYDVIHLDYVIATHPDADHIGGMQEVLSHVTVGEYLMSPALPHEEGTTAYTELMAYLAAQEVTVTEAAVGATRTFGSAVLTVLSASSTFEEVNDRSLVCRVDYQNNRFLFMGDAGEEVENTLTADVVDVDFLKVAHHGGADATSAEFLSKVTPAVAVISCGEGNVYGHPHGDVLRNLQRCNATVYRTDRMGTITVTGNGETLKVTTEGT